MILKRFTTLSWLSILATLLLSCNPNVPDVNHNPLILESRTAQIYLEDYLFYLTRNYPEIAHEMDDELHSYVFDSFKRDLLMSEIDQFRGFRIKDDQVDAYIKDKLAGLSAALTLPAQQRQLRAAVQRRLAIRQFLNREILSGPDLAEEQVAQFYKDHEDNFKKDALYRVRFVKFVDEPREKGEAEPTVTAVEQANAFYTALRKSKDPFVTLAGEFTEDEGYLLPVTLPLESFSDHFRETIRKLRSGRYSKVIHLKMGKTDHYYVLYLESVISAVQFSYEDSYHYVLRDLRRQQCRQRLEETIKKFEKRIPLEVHRDRLPFSYIEPDKRKEV